MKTFDQIVDDARVGEWGPTPTVNELTNLVADLAETSKETTNDLDKIVCRLLVVLNNLGVLTDQQTDMIHTGEPVK